jgi:hypothetical protein
LNKASYKMSISNKKSELRKKASFSLSCSSGVFIITSMLLVGGGFALNSSTSTSMTTAAFAQEEGNNTTAASTPNSSTTATTTTNTSSGIKLSPQPIYQESTPPGRVTPINQTHIAATHTGNGTLTLPNSNQTINVISNGTAIASLETPSAIAKTTIRASNGETATITIYEIIQFSNPAEAPLGGGKGFKIFIFHTNSTGMLAPLDGVIAAGINDIQPNGESELTAWRWESGIPLSTGATATATTTPAEDSPPMETPTATYATADDTTATATAPPVEGGGEEQATTTIPPTPLLE